MSFIKEAVQKELIIQEFEYKLIEAFDFADKNLDVNETFEIIKESFENYYNQITLNIGYRED